MPFADHVFTSVSCFLGLQDIRIGFGEGAVHEALAEGIRVLRPKGTLVLLDEFPFERFGALLDGFPIKVMDRAERALEVRWTRQVAERAIKLYAEGWLAQSRLETPRERERLYDEVYARMLAEMEQQLSNQGYYVPFGPVRIVVAQRTYST
jgi:ubiquinone/menaquinone biosynthesis C-methylase UbiE